MKEEIIQLVLSQYLLDERVREVVAQYQDCCPKRVVYYIIKDNLEAILKDLEVI